MKKGIVILSCLVLTFALCACGGQEKEPTTPPTVALAQTEAPQIATEEVAAPETTAPQQTESEQDMVALVREYIDKPIEELYEVIGQPLSSDYASSCIGDGEDGLLIYDGFVVYTYREGDVETVYDVE